MNKTVILKNRPSGKIKSDDFELDEQKVDVLNTGEVKIEVLYLSIDPAITGKLRAEKSYAESIDPGDTVPCFGIGKVTESQHRSLKEDDLVFAETGMQEISICQGDHCTRLNPFIGKPSLYLSMFGIAGLTAYFGLFEIGKPKAGETIVISAGTGSVGTMVNQLAKIAGCKTIALVGTEKKAFFAINELSYDHALVYKKTGFDNLLSEVCTNGIDIFFDNVGGDIPVKLFDYYNNFARIVVCGRMAIAHYDHSSQDTGIRDHTVVLRKRIRKQGFIVTDYKNRYFEALLNLIKWHDQGKISMPESIYQGIEKAPEAFIDLLNGKNIGKQLVEIKKPDPCGMNGSKFQAKLITSNLFPTKLISKLIKTLAK